MAINPGTTRQPTRLGGLWRRAQGALRKPHVLLGLGLLALLTYLVFVPILTLIHTSSTVQLVDSFRLRDLELGQWTTHYWQRVLTSASILHRPLMNSLVTGFGVVLFVTVVGTLLAWLVTRTNLPFAGLISAVVVIPYILPSWALAFPWVQVFQNRALGLPQGFLEYYTGIQVPEAIVFGPLPIIFVLGLHYYPFVFLFVAGALKSIDSQIEETADVLGASRFRILRTITFPIVIPAILSAAILGFSKTIGSFGTPSILGLPAGYNVLPGQIRALMNTGRSSDAFILALVLIFVVVGLLIVNGKIVGKRKSYVTIGGKGMKSTLTDLGRWRFPIAAGIVGFVALFVIAPLALLAWSSFMLNVGSYSADNFTLQYWTGDSNPRYVSGEPGILKNPLAITGAYNSVRIAVIGASITAVLGLLVGYVVVRGRGTFLSSIIEKLSFAPLLIPSIAFGAIYLSLFAVTRGPIPALYGTLALLILVVVGKQIPYTARSGISSMHQVAGELEEAAQIQGASWFHRFRTIIWPLTRGGFVAGFLLVVITTMRELSLFILLMTPQNQVLTTLTFNFFEIGARQLSYALMTLLVVLIFVILGITKLWERLSSRKAIG